MAETEENGEGVKEALFGRLERELIVHTLAEENIFLPHVEDAIEDSKQATAEFFDENADRKQLSLVLKKRATPAVRAQPSSGEGELLIPDAFARPRRSR